MDTFFHRVSNHCFFTRFTVFSALQRGVRNPFYTFLEVLLFLDLVLENYLSFNEPRFIGFAVFGHKTALPRFLRAARAIAPTRRRNFINILNGWQLNELGQWQRFEFISNSVCHQIQCWIVNTCPIDINGHLLSIPYIFFFVI